MGHIGSSQCCSSLRLAILSIKDNTSMHVNLTGEQLRPILTSGMVPGTPSDSDLWYTLHYLSSILTAIAMDDAGRNFTNVEWLMQ